MIRAVTTILLLACATPALAQTGVNDVLTAFVDAQRNFDVARLDALLAPDYVEISPAGEVDPRAKVLTFYAPDKKIVDAPAAALDELSTRAYGDIAVTIARLTYQMKGPNGTPVSRSMRCVFVTRIIGGARKIVSAQYTAIR